MVSLDYDTRHAVLRGHPDVVNLILCQTAYCIVAQAFLLC